ncbi:MULTISPECIES: hypothetical protein [unclassified Streptomyces]|uniref:hypothetical protein n=1 Tax=unclassified Streptomyces TaxID=2593676 RepID=UPI000F4A5F58|nr:MULTISPECIES: hypothetical protein [unclassified Streptomyces]MCX4770430.1 hypothetical protein [Streptomyces sp. NBC_01285]ROQ82184.1 hypothetical protein EDD95_1792 [Streptomyces sp. CEV 2-1]
MSRRSALPPPPPPVEIRAWPDRGALLADRALILGELVKMHLGPGRLGLLWLWGALGALGWSLVGAALVTLEESYDVFSAFFGVVFLVLGVGCLVPAVILVVVGLRRDRVIRRLLAQWGELDRDPVGDRALRLPGTSLVWLLGSFLLCALGLYACVAVPAGAVRGEDTYGLMALVMGLGFIGWLIGLTGVTKALLHRRWVLRVLIGAPAPASLISSGGGAHR